MLLALTREDKLIPGQCLAELGIEFDSAKQEILEIISGVRAEYGSSSSKKETVRKVAVFMHRFFLRSKIHRAVVTEADVDYVGSISIDEDLMDAARLAEYEQVHVVGLSGGERLITYVIKAPRGSGIIGINGAAALKIVKDEKVIIFAYAMVEDDKIKGFEPELVFVDEQNKITKVTHVEKQGEKFSP